MHRWVAENGGGFKISNWPAVISGLQSGALDLGLSAGRADRLGVAPPFVEHKVEAQGNGRVERRL
jgi:hypothetical protein